MTEIDGYIRFFHRGVDRIALVALSYDFKTLVPTGDFDDRLSHSTRGTDQENAGFVHWRSTVSQVLQFARKALGLCPGSTGCQPVTFGSLPKDPSFRYSASLRNVVGKLPTTTGWQPVLPR